MDPVLAAYAAGTLCEAGPSCRQTEVMLGRKGQAGEKPLISGCFLFVSTFSRVVFILQEPWAKARDSGGPWMWSLRMLPQGTGSQWLYSACACEAPRGPWD